MLFQFILLHFLAIHFIHSSGWSMNQTQNFSVAVRSVVVFFCVLSVMCRQWNLFRLSCITFKILAIKMQPLQAQTHTIRYSKEIKELYARTFEMFLMPFKNRIPFLFWWWWWWCVCVRFFILSLKWILSSFCASHNSHYLERRAGDRKRITNHASADWSLILCLFIPFLVRWRRIQCVKFEKAVHVC